MSVTSHMTISAWLALYGLMCVFFLSPSLSLSLHVTCSRRYPRNPALLSPLSVLPQRPQRRYQRCRFPPPAPSFVGSIHCPKGVEARVSLSVSFPCHSPVQLSPLAALQVSRLCVCALVQERSKDSAEVCYREPQQTEPPLLVPDVAGPRRSAAALRSPRRAGVQPGRAFPAAPPATLCFMSHAAVRKLGSAMRHRKAPPAPRNRGLGGGGRGRSV